MSQKTKSALSQSIDTFEDISGITVNKKTGNIVTGHHRWDDLCSRYGGQNKLSLDHIVRDYYSLVTKSGVHTGFLVRIVDWPLEKEKAANVTANSDLISGEFTPNLQNLLSEIKLELNEDLFSALRLDELHIDIEGFDDDLDLSDNVERKRQKSADRENKKSKKDKQEDEVPTISLIKVSCPTELFDEVKDDLLEFLAKKKYYNKITVV